MKQEPFHRSKFLLGIVAIGLIVGCWRWAVFHLYSLPETSIAAFQSITSQMLWAVSAIALTIAGVKGVQQMMAQKMEVASQAITQAVSEHSVHEEIIVDETAKNENLKEHQE